MKHITVDAFKEIVETETKNDSVDFVNVCTPVEYKEGHISGVRNVPLSDIDGRLDEFKDKKTIYVHCRSGNRSMQAIERLQRLGITAELVNVEGGILAWGAAGYGLASLTNRIPILRQMFIVAGGLVLAGIFLAEMVHPSFVFVNVFVGAGLVFAGVTGWCGMAFILEKMPWNK